MNTGGRNNLTSVYNPTFSDALLEWAAHKVKEHDLANVDVWPSLHAETHGPQAKTLLDTGLRELHVYVISMESSKKRRESFAKRFKKLGMKWSSVQWLPAINGFNVPPH